MFSPIILITAILNGLLTGAVYALVALGLTLIYGVLHIINFAHGALLSMALFAAFFAFRLLGLDPYLAALVLAPALFAFGYALQRFIIGPASHGDDRNMLLVTLGLSVVIENMLLYGFRADTRTIDVRYAFQTIDLGFTFLPIPRVIGFGVVFAVALVLWGLMSWTDIGKAIRAVAKEKLGAQLAGIDVRACLCDDLRIGHGLCGHRGLPVDPDLLREPDGRRSLRADRLHHCGARRHGLGAGRADRWAADWRGGKPVGPFSRRIARPDRHLSDLHRGLARAPDRAVRSQGMTGVRPIIAVVIALARGAADH